MPAIVVSEERCKASQTCLYACPYNAIGMVAGSHGHDVAFIYDNCIDCMMCLAACPEQAILTVAADGTLQAQEVHSGIWVALFETSSTAISLVRIATELARPLGAWTGVILMGKGDEAALKAAGANVVEHHQTDDPEEDPRALIDLLVEVIAERQPEALLFLDSAIARDTAARLAWRLQLGLITDVVAVENDLSERRVLFTKGTVNSPIQATVVTITRPQMALMRM